MRVLLTADTHGPRHRLPSWLLEAAGGADFVVHAGDVCDLGTLQALAGVAPVYAVQGNRDLGLHLPERLALNLAGIAIGVVHGHQGPGGETPERAWQTFLPRPDVIVFGHSHRHLLERRGSTWLLNPGSPTSPKDGRPSAMILESAERRLTWWRVGPDGLLRI